MWDWGSGLRGLGIRDFGFAMRAQQPSMTPGCQKWRTAGQLPPSQWRSSGSALNESRDSKGSDMVQGERHGPLIWALKRVQYTLYKLRAHTVEPCKVRAHVTTLENQGVEARAP